MTEPTSTEEENSSPPLPEILIGIDIGRSPCCVSVWNGSKVEIWKDKINEMIKRFFETFGHDFTDGASSSNVSLSQAHGDAVFILKLLIDMLFHESANFPFLMHTLDIKVRPFIAAFVNKVWKSATAVELLFNFLVYLKKMVETELKQPIRNVVFIVPVSFSRLQQTRLRVACEMADLKVIRLIPQPTAVALYYARQQLQASASSHEGMKTALIFNMDAGYCDVAVITTEKGKCSIKALAGSTIGGEDLLGNMMCHLVPDSENIFRRQVHGDTEITSMAVDRNTVQNVITQLSYKTSVKVSYESVNGLKIRKDVIVTQEEFEDLNKEVFEKCERLIIQCIQDAGIEVENINDVIIVGGCCNIPRVESLVTKICKGKEPYKLGGNPLDDILCAATVAAAVDDPSGDLDLFTPQVTLLSIGIRADGNKFVPIIPRNTSVPTMGDILLTTIHDNQTAALIVVYEGEGEKVEENHLLGYFTLNDIPEAPKGVPKIIVSMDIDHKSTLTVTASAGIPPSVLEIEKFNDELIAYCDESVVRKNGDTMGLVTLNMEE